MKLQAPCKNCTDRQMGCHATCEKYQEYSKQVAQQRLQRRIEYFRDKLYWDATKKGRKVK